MTKDQNHRAREQTPYAKSQRTQQAEWKRRTTELPDGAKGPGRWQEAMRVPFILPTEFAEWNLWEPIREPLLALFRDESIAWHDEDSRDYGPRSKAGPTPHLLSSQVACLNFWCGLALAPATLTHVLRDAFPDMLSLEPPTYRPELLAPEWMGTQNYLGEQDSLGRRRRRGQYATSADLFLVYRDRRGARHGILLESKYTESYRDAMSCADSRRLGIYRPHLEAATSPIHLPLDIDVEELFIEPFYQLMRQQLLAAAMEADKALGLLTVAVLHVSPAANRAFNMEVPRNLAHLGNDVTDVWSSMLIDRSKFRTTSYEAAWRRARESDAAELQGWYEYQEERYPWQNQHE